MKKTLILFAFILAFAPRGFGDVGVGTFNYLIEHDDLEKLKILIKGAKPGKDSRHPKTGLTSLMVAAECGSMEVAKYLLSLGSQVNMTDFYGCTPLMHAAMDGKVEMIKLLLDKGANINAMDQYKATALYWAISYEKWDAAKYLLSRGIKCDTRDVRGGATPLHYAVTFGNLEVVKLLLQKGVDINTMDYLKGITALHLACEYEHGAASREIALYLLSLGAKVNTKTLDWNETPLHAALRSGMNDVAKMLIDRGADLTVVFEDKKKEHVRNGANMLMHAALAKKTDPGICEFLVAKGADVNQVSSYGKTALWYTAYSGNEEMARWLLDRGADPEKGCDTYNGQTPLHVAAVKGQLGIMKMLYRKGMDIDVRSKSKSTPLMYAASAGHQEVAEWLIDKGADMKANNAENSDAFVQAATRGTVGHAGIAELLLKKGAGDPNTVLRDGTILMFSAKRSDNAMVRLLLKYGAKVNAVEKNTKDTALHYAAWYGDVQTVKLLLDAGANPNAATRNGITPLFDAVDSRDPLKVKALLDAGADPNAALSIPSAFFSKGATPLFSAVGMGRLDIAKMLIAAGAKVNVKLGGFPSTPIEFAAHAGYGKNVAFLLDQGADPDEGCPLRIAVQGDSGYCLEMAKALINKGANVNAVYKGDPVLHAACRNIILTKLLVEKGADVNARNEYGQTVFWKGFHDTLPYLFSKGADPSLQDNQGNTALMEKISRYCEMEKIYINVKIVAWKNNLQQMNEDRKSQQDLIKLLLDTGKANVNAVNKDGMTALKIALKIPAPAGKKIVVDMLRKAGAVK